jgi:hypothetical protein
VRNGFGCKWKNGLPCFRNLDPVCIFLLKCSSICRELALKHVLVLFYLERIRRRSRHKNGQPTRFTEVTKQGSSPKRANKGKASWKLQDLTSAIGTGALAGSGVSVAVTSYSGP